MDTNLPETVFVALEEPGTEDEWLNTRRSVEELYDADEPVRVGVYKLVEVVEVSMKVETKRISP